MGNFNKKILCLFILLDILISPLYAEVITVGQEPGYDFSQIQAAIDFVDENDEIIVYPGTYTENLQIKGNNIILRAHDYISSPGLQGVIIDGGHKAPVITFAGTETEGYVVSGFVIINGDSSEGGGILGNGTHATIRGNYITYNNAVNGGGIHGCDGIIENNIIARNLSSGNGGGIASCNGVIRNNTLWNNSANTGGGMESCNGTIINCILWQNFAIIDTQISNSSIPDHCCIQSWEGSGENNIDVDPLLKDPNNGDFHIQIKSPCIDRGGNVDLTDDFEGNGRPYDSISWKSNAFRSDFDIGADEYEGYSPYPFHTLYVPFDYTSIQSAIDNSLSYGTEIVVSPGTYEELVDFKGINCVLRSTNPQDPLVVENTIIQGDEINFLITFSGSETCICTLAGLTITKGLRGINGNGTKATIEYNIISNNGGIHDNFGMSSIDRGAGIYSCNGMIANNIIRKNDANSEGGGLNSCHGIIANNTIYKNRAWGYSVHPYFEFWYYGDGGGLSECHGIIQNNLIYYNNVYSPLILQEEWKMIEKRRGKNQNI